MAETPVGLRPPCVSGSRRPKPNPDPLGPPHPHGRGGSVLLRPLDWFLSALDSRQFSTRHMASHEHRENHLSRLPPPAPLVPSSKHSDQLHRDCGTAFTPPANGGPPSRAAQRKRINAGVKGDSVIFAQDEETTHAPIRSSICGGKSGHCHIDVSSQNRPRTTADHSADLPSHRLGYPRGGTTAMSTDGRSLAQIARTS